MANYSATTHLGVTSQRSLVLSEQCVDRVEFRIDSLLFAVKADVDDISFRGHDVRDRAAKLVLLGLDVGAAIKYLAGKRPK